MNREQVVVVVRDAAAAVEAADVDSRFEVAAFEYALKVLAGSKDELGGLHDVPTPADVPRLVAGTNSIDRVASALRVDRAAVSRVLEIDGDGVHIVARRTDFASTAKEATKEVVLLVAAARQAAGLDEFTPFDLLRGACEHMGVLDGPNFSKAVAAMRGIRLKKVGSRKSEIKLNQVGLDAAGVLVNRLAAVA